MNRGQNNFEELVANLIRDVPPEIIRRVIDTSNSEGFIAHGIETEEGFQGVMRQGVLPNTPHGEGKSYWSSGSRIFGYLEDGELKTYDTPFFHYTHSRTREEGLAMTFAIAHYHSLPHASKKKSDFKQDSYVKIGVPVSRDSIHLLRVEASDRGPFINRVGYKNLLLMLDGCLKDFRSGDITRKQI